MKTHYCLVEKTQITYEGECSWCGDKETVTFGKHHKQMMNLFKQKKLNDEEILEAIEEFRSWKNPPYKKYEDTYMDGWLDACNEIYSAVFEILKKENQK